MDETAQERVRRLRPLVPNCVTDQRLQLCIAEGWSDRQIVTRDLHPQFGSPTTRLSAGAARRRTHISSG